MSAKFLSISCSLILAGTLFISCQKELDGVFNNAIVPVDQKPKLGTTWKYIYTRYYSFGPAIESYFVTYKAVSEVEYGGEKWLNIVDTITGATVFLLNVKPDGLYRYSTLPSNNNGYLLCKYPAVVNDTYTSTFGSTNEKFTVKAVNDSIPTGINGLKVNFYQGIISNDIIDEIWYSDKVWIARYYIYERQPLSPFTYYRYKTLVLQKIIY